MKKVLIISYYWPPSGGGGVQRWLKFAKYLPAKGWQPVIYTPENPQFDQQDRSLLKDIDPALKIIKSPIREPYRLLNKLLFFKKRAFKQGVVSEKEKSSIIEYMLSWIRGNFFLPDPRVTWVKPSVKLLQQVVQQEDIDAIITTGPPHSMHLIGLQLKYKTGLPWVADFRDPWSEWDILDLFHLTKKSRKIHVRQEHEVISTADLTLTVSESWADMLQQKGARATTFITNGYDAQDFVDFRHRPHQEFRLLHAGLLNDFRSSSSFWQMLDDVLASNQGFRGGFRLVLAGNVSQRVLQQISSYPHLQKTVQYLGYIDHASLMHEYEKAGALLLLQNESKNSGGHIPGKFFEYLATGVPIFALGNPSSDMAKILNKHNFTGMIRHDDLPKQKETLLNLWSLFSEGTPPAQRHAPDVFARHQLTKSLGQLLDNLTSVTTPTGADPAS